MGQAWDLGDSLGRRELLLTMFDKFYIRDGRIFDFVARLDRRDEVRELVRLATGGGEVEVEALLIPRTGRLRPVLPYGGKGGI